MVTPTSIQDTNADERVQTSLRQLTGKSGETEFAGSFRLWNRLSAWIIQLYGEGHLRHFGWVAQKPVPIKPSGRLIRARNFRACERLELSATGRTTVDLARTQNDRLPQRGMPRRRSDAARARSWHRGSFNPASFCL